MRRFNFPYPFFTLLVCAAVLCLSMADTVPADDGSQMPAGNHSPAITVTVAASSVLENEVVLLGDIARVDAPEMLKEAIDGIEISPSPKPDKIKSISRRRIVSSVNRQRFLPEDITIQSPEQVYVKRAAQLITESDVREYILSIIAKRFKDKEYKLLSLNVRGITPYPLGDVMFRMDSDEMVDPNGRISTAVYVYVDGRKEDRLNVLGKMEVYERVLCAIRPIGKGESVRPEDVVLKKKNIFDLHDTALTDLNELHRMAARILIKEGEYLISDMFEPVPLVKKGDIVRLLTRNGNLQILTTGISKEDGFADKLIRAENLSSGKPVKGIVRGKSTVEVIY